MSTPLPPDAVVPKGSSELPLSTAQLPGWACTVQAMQACFGSSSDAGACTPAKAVSSIQISICHGSVWQ